MTGLLRMVDAGIWAMLRACLVIFTALFAVSWTTRHLVTLERYAERLWLPAVGVLVVVALAAWVTGRR